MSKSIKLIIIGLLLFFVAALVSIRETQNNQPKDTYSVKKVIDGDTIEIERYGKAEKVRMIGIDTPETLDPRKPVQCFGKEASDKSKDLLSGGRVRLEFDPIVGQKDKYNRLLAYVWSNNELVNLKLIKEGYANEYTYRSQSYKYQNEFKNAQIVAKESSIGLWSPQTCNGKTK
jgi:micrococcal nuclease